MRITNYELRMTNESQQCEERGVHAAEWLTACGALEMDSAHARFCGLKAALLIGERDPLWSSVSNRNVALAAQLPSPSPQPSPAGRGSDAPRLLVNFTGSCLQRDGLQFSLSPGERAGVRGKASPGFFVWLATALAILLPSVALADSFLLTGATVHTVSGATFSPGQVLVKDGRIAAVGVSVNAAGARLVDLKGLHLFPGLITPSTSLGLVEIDGVRATRDMVEVGDYHPEIQSWQSVNPDSELVPVARANGVTHALPVPAGGVVSGQSGLIALDGWTSEQMTVQKPVALHVTWPSLALDTTPREQFSDRSRFKSLDEQAKERSKKLKELEDFFDEAKAYGKGRAAGGKQVVPAWEAMLPYVRGELPLMVHADDVRQIKSAVAWAATNQFRIVLAGARDAWMVADLLAEKKIPVIYERVYNMGYPLAATAARDTAPYDVHFSAPGVLHKAGVKVAFSESTGGDNAATTRNLPYSAAQAVAFGLPLEEGLRGITLSPAEILGVADRLGSIEVGKEASLVAATGHILDIRSQVKHVWIAGREMSLETRHTRLYEKYKGRPLPK